MWIKKSGIYTQYTQYIYIHTYNGNITQLLKRNKILSTTWMDLENIILSKVRQTENNLENIILSKVRQTENNKYKYVFTYIWNLKKKEYSKTKTDS